MDLVQDDLDTQIGPAVIARVAALDQNGIHLGKLQPWEGLPRVLKHLANIAAFGAFLCVVAFFGLMLWRALFSSETVERHAEAAQEAPLQQNRSTEAAATASRETSSSSHNSEEVIAHYTIWIAAFTGLLVLATIALFVSGERNVEVAITSARAATEAAKAARDAVNLARETAERQLRAYVFVDASEIRNFGTNLPLEGWLMLKNTGSTPAYDLERSALLMLTPFPAAQFPTLTWGGARSHIGPNGEVHFGPIPIPRALTPAENAAVIAGTSALYLFGEIKYRDAFNQIRTTSFRLLYKGSGTAPSGPTLATIHDGDGNNSD